MSNLPSLLKEAILEQDWSKASSVYELLTGEAVTTPETPKPQPVIEDAEAESSDHIANSYKGSSRYDSVSTEGAARREAMDLSERKNDWVDDGSIAAEEMVSKNPSLGVSNPVARNRPTAQQKTTNNTGDMRVDRSPKLEK